MHHAARNHGNRAHGAGCDLVTVPVSRADASSRCGLFMKDAASRHLRPAVVVRLVVLIVALIGSPAIAQKQPEKAAATETDESAELAKKLQNPVAALISVPFQSNFEWGAGPQSEGFKYTLNFQPVIPFSISEHWNVISRTILPIIHQDDVMPVAESGGAAHQPAARPQALRRRSDGRARLGPSLCGYLVVPQEVIVAGHFALTEQRTSK